jgi:hypothetical protein
MNENKLIRLKELLIDRPQWFTNQISQNFKLIKIIRLLNKTQILRTDSQKYSLKGYIFNRDRKIMIDYIPSSCGHTKSQHFYVLGWQHITDKNTTHFYKVCNFAGFKPL